MQYLYSNTPIMLSFDPLEKKTTSTASQFCQGKQLQHKPSMMRKLSYALRCRPWHGETRPTVGCKNCSREAFPVSRPLVVDLRLPQDFERGHVHGSYNFHLSNLTDNTAGGDIFGDANMIHSISASLKALLENDGLQSILSEARSHDRTVVVVCYHGDASGLATAALRARGITAFCVQKGFSGLGDAF